MKLHKHTNQIFTIDNFCTQQECQEMISHSNETGYSPALIHSRGNSRWVPEYRNNTRVFQTSFEMAEQFWQKLKPVFSIQIGKSVPVGFNEMFRFYKYEPGEFFARHTDSPYYRTETECSYYTFLLYLNEGYTGGQTAFADLVIEPKTGMALIFHHSLLHEGLVLTEGIKYVLRSDIMFRYMETEA